MVGHESGVILRQMQALLNAGTFSGLSDRQLLEQFLERQDEVAELAFAVLVERHGPMVLGVCRRILRDPHDAEDAFQATFLVLARKGRSVRVEGSLGGWLFGVATRVATRARSDERRRRARERSGLDRLDRAGSDTGPADIDRAEIQATIALEIAGLPARFQAPVLLCDLEGTSYEEAARRLGWPVGTVKSRLSRARARLRERLTRRGLAPAESSIVTALLPTAPSSSLVAATTRAALALISGRLTSAGAVSASVATLTQGVLWTMTFNRLKLIAAAILLVATCSAVLFGQAAAQKAAGGGVEQAPNAAAPANDDRIDLEMLERAWVDAINRRDTTVIGRILAGDFEGIDPVGSTINRASYLAQLKNGGLAPGVALDELKVRLYGDTGVVISQLKTGSPQGSERATKVYIKRQGRWICVAAHVDWFHGVGFTAAVVPADAAFGARAGEGWKNEWRTFNALQKSSCVACHSVNIHEKIPPDHPAPAPVKLPGANNSPVKKDLEVEIDAQGAIKIQGKPVAAEKKDLEHRLKAGKEETRATNLALATAAGAPHRVVTMVMEAGASIGFDEFSIERPKDPAKSPVPLDPPRPAGHATNPADRTSLIRPPLDCRVVRTYVNVGEAVKKGAPLLDLASSDLAAAKGEYELAASQWAHDKKMYDHKRPMGDNYMIPRKDQIDVENDEAQSRLKMKLARDRLLICGLTEEEIANIPKENGLEKTRFTLRSPVDGAVIAVGARLGEFYDRKDVLIRIRVNPATKDPQP
jgi:RNA polymerase sigma factor (sigma-70 family)